MRLIFSRMVIANNLLIQLAKSYYMEVFIYIFLKIALNDGTWFWLTAILLFLKIPELGAYLSLNTFIEMY